MSFYRKYRPQRLNEIVEQDHVKKTFLNALKKGGLVHAYIFSGSRGTGKTSTARIIARALNCQKPTTEGEPCNECEICQAALENRLVDLIEIDAASNRGIDEIRDLKEKITFAPSQAKNKFYIIDEVHMLTKEAFNALLKTLEEPPAHAYFILATTEPHKVPETILSRCQRFDFHRIDSRAIFKHLTMIAEQEKIKFEERALELIAKQAAGGMRDALGMLEQLGSGGEITAEDVADNLGLTRPQTVEDFAEALLSKKLETTLEIINGLVREGANLIQFNKSVLMLLREKMLEQAAQNQLAATKQMLGLVAEFARAGEGLKNAIIPQLPLEMAAVQVCSASVISQPSPKISAVPQPATHTVAVEKNLKSNIRSAAVPTPPKVDFSDAAAVHALGGELLEKVFPQVLAGIKQPSLKSILKQSSIVRITDEQIVLGVGSDFLLEKISSSQSKNDLSDLFSTLLGRNLRVEAERVELKLESSAPEPQAAKKSLAEAAAEIFENDF